MKTSAQWWSEVKQDENLFIEWLQKQYRGEVSAVRRLRQCIEHFSKETTEIQRAVLNKIKRDEAQHALWVKQLLMDRDVEPQVDDENSEKRYWAAQDLSFEDFTKTMAIACHAENMRLERIQVIASDLEAPADVRRTFENILRDEQFHADAFYAMAGNDAVVSTEYDHEVGRRLLGLEA